jgi:hypothetical protein
MKLSEMKFEDIEIGQRVQSDNTGCLGSIIDKKTQEEANNREDNIISITWDNGKKSLYV